jgi:hypothetical protein
MTYKKKRKDKEGSVSTSLRKDRGVQQHHNNYQKDRRQQERYTRTHPANKDLIDKKA